MVSGFTGGKALSTHRPIPLAYATMLGFFCSLDYTVLLPSVGSGEVPRVAGAPSPPA